MEQKDKYNMYRELKSTVESWIKEGKIVDYSEFLLNTGIVFGVQFRTSMSLNELKTLISDLESRFNEIGFGVCSNGLNRDMDGWDWDLNF